MNMNRLFARYGFKSSDLANQVSLAGKLLFVTLMNLGIRLDHASEVNETDWFTALMDASRQNRLGGECLVNPLLAELPLADIDPYMRGIVRWMNELGMSTAYCCDGHGRRTPYVVLLHPPTSKQISLLQACLPEGLNLLHRGDRITFETNGEPRELLLTYAERLHHIVLNPDQLLRYEADVFKRFLMELLEIPGESGAEDRIRREVMRKLRRLADNLYVDRTGNVLATIYCGDGPTVLLSAHMDVYQEIDLDRQIVQEGTVLSSTSGILGADDRAGIAVILKVCESIHRTNFNGKLKVAFTVKEEVGLVGARGIDPWFMRDVDAAIVVDRRGNRDIVSSCRGVIPYCSMSYAQLFEHAGILAGMNDWKVTEGGSSDARIYAEQFGINTVNLSAGYRNEHTALETVDYLSTYETFKLIQAALHHQLLRKSESVLNV